jgi:hypothetical protein
MSTNWFDISLDARGSLNLPAPIKQQLGLGTGSPFFAREVDGIVILVPRNGDAAQAHQSGTLEAWVNDRLHSTLPPAPVTLGATALAEAARTQRAREKHEMKMREMQMQHALILARRGVTAVPASPPAPHNPEDDEPDSRRDVLAELGLPQADNV